jgi:hypothetical protein
LKGILSADLRRAITDVVDETINHLTPKLAIWNISVQILEPWQHGKGATQFSLAGLIFAASTLLPESILFTALTQAWCSVIALILLWSIPNSQNTNTSS